MSNFKEGKNAFPSAYFARATLQAAAWLQQKIEPTRLLALCNRKLSSKSTTEKSPSKVLQSRKEEMKAIGQELFYKHEFPATWQFPTARKFVQLQLAALSELGQCSKMRAGRFSFSSTLIF